MLSPWRECWVSTTTPWCHACKALGSVPYSVPAAPVSAKRLTWPLCLPPAQPATAGIAKPVQASRAAQSTDDVGPGRHACAIAAERARMKRNDFSEPSEATLHC